MTEPFCEKASPKTLKRELKEIIDNLVDEGFYNEDCDWTKEILNDAIPRKFNDWLQQNRNCKIPCKNCFLVIQCPYPRLLEDLEVNDE